MRKHHKKMILELVETLIEANSEIKRVFLEKDMPTLSVLFDDCNAFTAQIADFVRQLDGENATFASLEQYKKLLKEEKDENLIKALQNQASLIKKTAEKELKVDKFEMLFIPYKASMFDCMESVWLAAKDDPQCEAYVMPIPYYEKNPDGSFGKLVYEGNQYPENIPITDWRQYNIEERCPDVIITHNIYNNDAFGTSIHPDFYTERLKEFTDMLVYIPYFADSGSETEKYLTAVKGVLHCDKIIVSSGKLRKSCIEMYRELYGSKHGNPNNKYVALGSPKFDKVINSKREDYALPEEWKQLIGDKKIILYNTTISVLINNDPQKWLDKLNYVIDTFRERDDVLLWWRPHPLLEAHMHSPLLEQYRKIVERYKHDKIGIFDDTPDMHRAIAWSDAYYGDGGSLLSLYGVTGKPVMQQIIINNNFIYLAFNNLYDDGEFFWFTALYFNALFKTDKQTWKLEYMGSFLNEKEDGVWLYGTITEHNRKLYFTPYSAKEISIYDIEEKRFDKISIDEKFYINGKYISEKKFWFSAVYKDYIFFFPTTCPAIIKYDTKNGELVYYTDWIKYLDEINKNAISYFMSKGCIAGNKIFLIIHSSNAIFEFDMEKCISRIYIIDDEERQYSGICFDGENFWLSPRLSDSIVRWDKKTNKYKKYSILPFIKKIDLNYNDMCCLGGHVWLFPHIVDSALKIKDDKIEIANEFELGYKQKKEKQVNVLFAKAINDKIYIMTGYPHRFIEYDYAANQRREQKNVYSYEKLKLHKYLNGLDKTEIKSDKIFMANTDDSTGEKIYLHCRGEII